MNDSKEVGSGPSAWSGPHCLFLGLSPSEARIENARAVILPVPYDGTTTFRAGTREGPRAILNASRELEFFDEETCTEAYRQGIATLNELPITVSSPKDMVRRVREAAEPIVSAGKLPVLLGGEHLVSLGMIEAVADHFPDVTVLHLDAHADLREKYQESHYSNACVMYQVFQRVPIVQAGIRSLTREEYDFIRDHEIPCFFAHKMQKGFPLWDHILPHLSSNVYVSIDLDVFDPSIMPAVGTPEPGGLGWYEVLALLMKVASKCRIVGFDVMELLPIPHNSAPDVLAARLVYKLLSYIFMNKPVASC